VDGVHGAHRYDPFYSPPKDEPRPAYERLNGRGVAAIFGTTTRAIALNGDGRQA
jgi:hypothetical protein